MEEVSFGLIVFSCFMALAMMFGITLAIILIHDFCCGVRLVIWAVRIWNWKRRNLNGFRI